MLRSEDDFVELVLSVSIYLGSWAGTQLTGLLRETSVKNLFRYRVGTSAH